MDFQPALLDIEETVLGAKRGWNVLRRFGTAEALHHSEVPVDQPTLMVQHVSASAVVLGSTQHVDSLNLDVVGEFNLQIARRRSGGGLVVLLPGEFAWIDVILPRGDFRWVDDVEQATWWLGTSWKSWLRAQGIDGDWSMHERGVSHPALGRMICFAAAGPGELFLNGQKIVGISQHRSKHRARFQCVLYKRFRGDLEAQLLATDRISALRLTVEELGERLRSSVRELPNLWGNVDQVAFDLIEHLET